MNALHELLLFDVRPLPKRRAGNSDPLLTKEARRLLAMIGEWSLAGKVRVLWYERLRSTAGIASFQDQTVFLNPKLLRFAPSEPGRTLRHELAHLVARHRAGRRRIDPHGAEWQAACAELGIAGEPATHNLALPRQQRERPYVYACPACGGQVQRTKPFRVSSACYHCCRKFSRGHYDQRFRYTRVVAEA